MENIASKMKNTISAFSSSSKSSKLLDLFQSTSACCGWNGPEDFHSNNLLESCCKQNKTKTGQSNCSLKSKNLITKGCSEVFEKMLSYFGTANSLIGLTIIAELLLIMATCCLITNIRLSSLKRHHQLIYDSPSSTDTMR